MRPWPKATSCCVPGQDTITGPKATLVIGESTGQFETPAYTLTRDRAPTAAGERARPVSGSGSADVLRLEGENQYRLKNATWSTCQASDPDWYIKARELELDYDRQVGTAQGGSIVFQDVPIFWMPWAEFPLIGPAPVRPAAAHLRLVEQDRRGPHACPTTGTSPPTTTRPSRRA